MPGLGRRLLRCGLGFVACCAIIFSCTSIGWYVGKIGLTETQIEDFYEIDNFDNGAFLHTVVGTLVGYLAVSAVPTSQTLGGMFVAENDSDHEAVSPGDRSDSEGKDAGEADQDSVHADVESAAMPKGFGWVTVALIAGGFYLGFN
eukprot:441450_1